MTVPVTRPLPIHPLTDLPACLRPLETMPVPQLQWFQYAALKDCIIRKERSWALALGRHMGIGDEAVRLLAFHFTAEGWRAAENSRVARDFVRRHRNACQPGHAARTHDELGAA